MSKVNTAREKKTSDVNTHRCERIHVRPFLGIFHKGWASQTQKDDQKFGK